jgi:hypothetical protein
MALRTPDLMRNAMVAMLMAVYVVAMAGAEVVSAPLTSLDRDHSGQQYFTVAAQDLWCITTETERTAAAPVHAPHTDAGRGHGTHAIVAHVLALSLNEAFGRYQHYLGNVLIRHRKHDLIFPFHYFW